jgi:hypothetical protein
MNVGGDSSFGPDVRWWIAGPGKDESLHSIVERAARMYGGRGEDTPLVDGESGPCASSLCNARDSRDLLFLARMLGTPSKSLYAHRLEEHPCLLEPSERRAFCPRCLYEDHIKQRPRSFRRVWAKVFTLSCPEHDVPLQWAERRLATILDSELLSSCFLVTPQQAEILKLVENFAQKLDACLWHGELWPTTWRGSPYSARALLIRCVANLTSFRGSLPASHLWISSSLSPLISFPTRPVEPHSGPPWNAVRQLGRPAWRRAALWLTLWQVIPGLSERCRPETIPSAYLADTDQWWGALSPSSHPEKLSRVYFALRRLCEPFPINEATIPPPRRSGPRRRQRAHSAQDLLSLSRQNAPLPDE